MLKSSITVVLVTTCQCAHDKAGSYRKFGGDVHLGLYEAFDRKGVLAE